ncbi:hypothetical protein CcaCcLH18_13462 [Colletotrichum camelliae]|nr:hypothetical protein CcaCcLH18_13462 [Colletotrichum camelliae]
MHFPSVLASLIAAALVAADNANRNCTPDNSGACNFGGTPRCLGVLDTMNRQKYFCVVSCPAASTCPSECSKAGKGGGWCGADNTGSSSGYCICENGHDTAHFQA